jgi:uncharacterized phage-associated protein
MPYSAEAIANEFLELAQREGRQLTPMQLQKLVYFAYGWYLVITGERLLDERVEAWQWGPVIPSLYFEFRRFGSGPITDFAKPLLASRIVSDNPVKDNQAKAIIRRVWEIYGKFSASDLSGMTHEPNSPWAKTPDKEVRGTDIDDAEIERYFRSLAQNEQRSPIE